MFRAIAGCRWRIGLGVVRGASWRIVGGALAARVRRRGRSARPSSPIREVTELGKAVDFQY